MPELKKALLCSCGGVVNGAYLDMLNQPVWKTLEVIELVDEINKKALGESSGDTNEVIEWFNSRATHE